MPAPPLKKTRNDTPHSGATGKSPAAIYLGATVLPAHPLCHRAAMESPNKSRATPPGESRPQEAAAVSWAALAAPDPTTATPPAPNRRDQRSASAMVGVYLSPGLPGTGRSRTPKQDC